MSTLLGFYLAWIFAALMFFWLGSVLYRTTRNTIHAGAEDSTALVTAAKKSVPNLPDRSPRIHLTTAA